MLTALADGVYHADMPRKLRIQFAGAMYHITSRADGKGDIFLNDVDRQHFLFLDGAGTTTVEKFGHTATRDTNDDYITFQ